MQPASRLSFVTFFLSYDQRIHPYKREFYDRDSSPLLASGGKENANGFWHAVDMAECTTGLNSLYASISVFQQQQQHQQELTRSVHRMTKIQTRVPLTDWMERVEASLFCL